MSRRDVNWEGIRRIEPVARTDAAACRHARVARRMRALRVVCIVAIVLWGVLVGWWALFLGARRIVLGPVVPQDTSSWVERGRRLPSGVAAWNSYGSVWAIVVPDHASPTASYVVDGDVTWWACNSEYIVGYVAGKDRWGPDGGPGRIGFFVCVTVPGEMHEPFAVVEESYQGDAYTTTRYKHPVRYSLDWSEIPEALRVFDVESAVSFAREYPTPPVLPAYP